MVMEPRFIFDSVNAQTLCLGNVTQGGCYGRSTPLQADIQFKVHPICLLIVRDLTRGQLHVLPAIVTQQL